MKKNIGFLLGVAMVFGGLGSPSISQPKPKVRGSKSKLEELEDAFARSSDEAWYPFEGYKFEHQSGYSFVVDTRDFAIKRFKQGVFTLDNIPYKVEKRPELYVHSAQELVNQLNRLYAESGGEGSWRMLTLKDQFRTLNWQLKYMRIYPYQDGYLVCNTDNFVFNKQDLSMPVNQEYLAFQKEKDN